MLPHFTLESGRSHLYLVLNDPCGTRSPSLGKLTNANFDVPGITSRNVLAENADVVGLLNTFKFGRVTHFNAFHRVSVPKSSMWTSINRCLLSSVSEK